MKFHEFLPFGLLGISIISLFLKFTPRKKSNHIVFTLTAIILAYLFGNVTSIGILYLLVTGFIFYLAISHKTKNIWIKSVFHILFNIVCFLLMMHIMPGFHNIKVFDAVKFSENSLPFTMYLNFDKPFIGIIIVAFLGLDFRKPISCKVFMLNFFICASILLVSAFLLNYIRLDLKFPSKSWLWATNNLLFVCFTEEAFFRKYVQNGLKTMMSSFTHGKYIALLFTSILFGLIHFKGGLSYILLACISGLFYGYLYLKTNRLEAAILTHFLLNLTHFIFFSYPALDM